MKLVIKIHPDFSDKLRALRLVQEVIDGGLVSDFGKSYCYLTTYTNKETNTMTVVSCDRNKSGSFTFNVWDKTQ